MPSSGISPILSGRFSRTMAGPLSIRTAPADGHSRGRWQLAQVERVIGVGNKGARPRSIRILCCSKSGSRHYHICRMSSFHLPLCNKDVWEHDTALNRQQPQVSHHRDGIKKIAISSPHLLRSEAGEPTNPYYILYNTLVQPVCCTENPRGDKTLEASSTSFLNPRILLLLRV